MTPNVLRHLPSVSELLDSPPLKVLVDRVSHNVVVARVRSMLDDLRREAQHAAELAVPTASELAERIARRIQQEDLPPLRPVINATGILLHDQLGSVPLADAALEELVLVSRGYANVNLEELSEPLAGQSTAVEPLLCELTGAEAAFVTTNVANATLLTLAALAAGREVAILGNQLAGNALKPDLADILFAAGVRPRETLTPINTIPDATATLLVVDSTDHTIGEPTSSRSLAELARLGSERRIPVIYMAPFASLIDLTAYGLPDIPQVKNSLLYGADLVLFAGEKTLGGPAAGIIVGRQDLVRHVRQHPLAPTLCADKLALAALAGTLRLYRKQNVLDEIPWLRLLATPLENLQQRAQRLAPQLAATPAIAQAEAQAITSLTDQPGPTCPLASWCISLLPAQGDATQLADKLRRGMLPIIARLDNDRVVLDLRSVLPSQDLLLVETISRLD